MHSAQWPVPENYLQLHALVREVIARDGAQCDLNWIDLSRVDSLNFVFQGTAFNGDISRWNTSHIGTMQALFKGCPFDGDISQWNMANVRMVENMFENSAFNGDISKWNMEKVVTTECMFRHSHFNGDVSDWSLPKLRRADGMFEHSPFGGDVSRWRPQALGSAQRMFHGSPFHGDLSNWSLPHMDGRAVVQMFPSTFDGVPPLVGETFRERQEYYTRFFKKRGQNKGMVRYLETHPFNALHLDLSLHSKRQPEGVRADDYAWVRAAKAVASGLGLQGKELRDHIMAHYIHKEAIGPCQRSVPVHDVGTLFETP